MSFGFFTVLLFLGVELFVLWCRCLSCVFWCCFAYVFALFFVLSLPKLSWKNSLDVRSGVFFLSSSGRRSSFLFLKRDSSGRNRAHPHMHFGSCSFFLSVSPPQPGLSPVLACVLSFWRFVGVPFWAPGDLAIFGFSRYLGGLRLLAPLLRPFSRTRGGKGASLLLVLVLFFPFLFCLHAFSSRPKWAEPE